MCSRSIGICGLNLGFIWDSTKRLLINCNTISAFSGHGIINCFVYSRMACNLFHDASEFALLWCRYK
ncbi:hypothetical protein QVD17_41578 [Tagetes erecta]|uniref:Uncharacterized protein n=1 Tax=Tagetes erecta TaxID=13708 RepID=A0AAD8JR00_TARER|nr:hypothetical protein QVD17_41578 [Tagetes erecta]